MTNQEPVDREKLAQLLQPYLEAQERKLAPKLNAIRSSSTEASTRCSNLSHPDSSGDSLTSEPREDIYGPADMIDNPVHPLLAEQNFITQLPMDDIRALLLPALQLATNFLSNERALEWFIYVKVARLYTEADLPTILISPEARVLRDTVESVKRELQDLAGALRFTWLSHTLTSDPDGSSLGISMFCLQNVLSEYQCSDQSHLRRYLVKQPSEIKQPFISLSIKYYLALYRMAYMPYQPCQLRVVQLDLAMVILHEIAHVWVDHCHNPTVEPLINYTDTIPEGGFSWEHCIFGPASVNVNLATFVVSAQLFKSRFEPPYYGPEIYLTHDWVTMWFLKSTWRNFTELHIEGALFAPSPANPTDHVMLDRFCPTSSRRHSMLYRKDHAPQYIGSRCNEPHCGACVPLQHSGDMQSLLKEYEELWQADAARVRANGIDASSSRLGSYVKNMRRMERIRVLLDMPRDQMMSHLTLVEPRH